jgi:hypothetical protein
VSNDVAGRAGIILIDPLAQTSIAAKVGGDVQAARDLITHELGHFVYELQDKASFTAAQSSVEARVEYCYMREAEASMFAFAVTSELKAQGIQSQVLGTSATPDLYNLISTSLLSGKNDVWSLTKGAFANDPQYAKYCKDNFGKVNAYIAPDGSAPAPNSGGDGTDATGPAGTHGSSSSGYNGGSSTGPYVPPPDVPFIPPSPTGGGHWEPIPQPSPGPGTNVMNPEILQHTEMNYVGLVGISTLYLS